MQRIDCFVVTWVGFKTDWWLPNTLYDEVHLGSTMAPPSIVGEAHA